MKLVKGLSLKNLTNALFVQFLHNILQIFLNLDPTKLKVKDEYDALSADTAKLDKEFKTDQGSDITDAMVKKDGERDRDFCGIRDNIKSYFSHYDGKKVGAAEKLMSNIGLYGTDANRAPLSEETALLNNMLNDWATNLDIKAAVTELGLDAWVAHLKLKNSEFEALDLSRSQEMGGKTDKGTQLARAASMNSYYALRDMFEAQYKANKASGDFPKALADFNGVIDNYNNMLSHKTSKKDGGTTPPQPK